MVSSSSGCKSTGKSIDLLKIMYGLFFANHRAALTLSQRRYVCQFYSKQLKIPKKTLHLLSLSIPVALVAVLALIISTDPLITNAAFCVFKLFYWGCLLVLIFNYVIAPVIGRLRVPKRLTAYDFYTKGRAFYSYPVPDALLAVLMQGDLGTGADEMHLIRQRIGQWLETNDGISTENIIQIIKDVHITHNTKSPQAVKDSALSTANTSTARANHDRYATTDFDLVVLGSSRGVVGSSAISDSGDSFSPSSSGSSSGSSSSSDSSSSSSYSE